MAKWEAYIYIYIYIYITSIVIGIPMLILKWNKMDWNNPINQNSIPFNFGFMYNIHFFHINMYPMCQWANIKISSGSKQSLWRHLLVVRCSLTSVFISFLIYLGALRFQKLPVEPDSISIHGGPIDITIIMSLAFCWNTCINRGLSMYYFNLPIPHYNYC